MKTRTICPAAGFLVAIALAAPAQAFEVIYRADQDTDETWELYRAERATPGQSGRIRTAASL